VFHRVNKDRNVLRSIKRKKAKSIGYVVHSNYCLKHVIESKTDGKIEVTEDEEEYISR
jgi:hypothetical protein